ncbi:hypothetical protein Cgig2_017847 [Carnegiea gigantea]|uniref:NB-ARC domain-containing protein n=1 Tax=Carnegiea gigantea TaxID=171969 RepID=A0A9Q1QRZ3_9CARY|nr:hypothetical protein Cgig2_017847 [Carnegiea gigantea]
MYVGLGKTTLCKSIFKTMEINKEFEVRIWICVSHDFEFIQLLNRVIEKIEGKHPRNIPDLHTLEAKLKEVMNGRKFLLVLDDIWDTFEPCRDPLRGCLEDVGVSKGNTILATSRLKGTLEKLDGSCILPLEKLSDEDSRSLFKQCVGENNLSDRTKADLGWEMLSRCDGVPLAIKALGRLLKSQNSTSQWRKIEQDHDILNKVDDILPSVMLSFKYLPSVERFDHLGNVQACKMHDVVRSLALHISKGDTEITERRSFLKEGLSLELSNGLIASLGTTQQEFIKQIKHLRALSLVDAGLEELPDWICELKHLRYLDISRNRIESLPIGLGKLYYLQTLIIADNFVAYSQSMPKFPKEFTKLNNLRHLCSNLDMEIPNGIGMLTSLQTLPAIDVDKHPWGGTASELGNLHNLKGSLQLTGFRDAGIIQELKEMKLGTKEKVEKLVLRFRSHQFRNEDVNMLMLEALEPHRNLVSLEIDGYQSKVLPNWMMEMKGYGGYDLNNLVSLDIRFCYFLEQLPSMKNSSALKILKISACERAKSLQNLECLTSLQCLDLIMCSEMQNLPDIKTLSCLEVLRINECRKMTCLPTGLSNLPNLKTLEISELSPDVSIFPFPNLNHLSPLSTCLRELHMQAYMMYKVVNLPNQIRHLCQLRYLEINNFTSLEELPEWLGDLTSLETLVLVLLPLVKYLPSQATMKGLSQLTTLVIHDCTQLEPACSPDGSEWKKIEHIRYVGELTG